MANFLDKLKNSLASWAQKNPQQAQSVLKLEKPVNKVKQAVINTPSYLLQGAKNVAIEAPKQANIFGKSLVGAIKAPFDFKNLQSSNEIDLGIADKYVKTAIKIKQTNPYMSQRLFERARELSQGASKRAQTMNDTLGRQKKELVSSGINTGLYALGGPASIQNPIATSMAAILGGGINKVMGGSYKEGVTKGLDSAVKFNAIAPITNPLISGLVGKSKTLVNNPLARQVVSRTVGGLGNVGENELMARLEDKKVTTPERLTSFGIGALLSSGGKPQDWDKLKADTKDIIVSGGKKFGKDVRPASDKYVMEQNNPNRNTPVFIYEALDKAKKGDYPMGLSVKAVPGTKVADVNAALKAGKITPEEAQLLQPPVEGGVPKYRISGNIGIGNREISVSEEIGSPQTHIPWNDIKGGGELRKALLEYEDSKGTGIENVKIAKDNLQKVYSDVVEQNPILQKYAVIDERYKPAPSVVEGGVNKVKKMIPSAKLYSTKFKTTKTGQTVIDDVMGDIPKKVVSHEEIKKATNIVNSETIRLLGDEQTKNMSAAFANLHNEINDLSKGGKVTPEISTKLKTLFEHRANAGRILDGLKVAYENEGAKNPLMTQYIEKAAKQLGDIDKVLKASEGVDFNNVEAANDFVRQFIKPKAEDWLTKLRYSSMLSSLNTWETNAESNLQGTGLIAPIEKTILGGIDWLSSSVTGKPRKYLAGEGVEYAKGYYNLGNLKDAFNKFKSIIKTGRATEVNKYEIGAIPLTKAGTVGRTVENIMDTPGRILLATDAFFQHLTSKGVEKSINYRQSKGVGAISDIVGAASTEARERLFNEELKTGSGGHISRAIGLLGDKVNSLRSNKNPIIRYMANFTLPFVKIPTNIMRTSIQYSPFGIADMLGSADKQASLAKIVLGTGVAMGTGLLASSDKITAGLPKSEKLRKAWKEANIQPWSVKIGDNWYSYQNLHPAIGFNMALAAHFKSNLQEIPSSQAEKVLGIFGVAANKIFAQSYTKNIANLFDAINGDATAVSKMASNYPSQLIPFRAFQGWLNRAFDPKVRNTDPEGTGLARQLDGIMKQVQNNIVGMSGNLPVRTNAYGEELQNSAGNRTWNSLFSPRTTTENAPGMEVFKNMLQNKNIDKQKQLDIQGIIKNSPQTQQVGSQTTTQTTGDAGLDLVIKQETEKARIKTISDILTRKGDYKDVPLGETQTQRLFQMEKVQPQEIEQAKIKAVSSLGTAETVQYIKSQPSVDFTALYKQGALTPAVAQEMDRQGYIPDADQLIKNMKLTDVYQQNKAIRKIKTSSMKKILSLQKSTMKKILNRKIKTVKYKSPKIPKVKKIKVKSYKFPKIKVKL